MGGGAQYRKGKQVGERVALIWVMHAFSFVLVSCLQKMAIKRVDRGCERKLSLSGRRGAPSHKSTRVHNNLKSSYLII